ncbi:hypothetical protein RF11_00360 [Thelohanellus kitauei]|uniref:Uncharacterized protein n=1 Tax=Thelohanellus kitauei TaxID=669202 RepID=A0A0C2NIE7_THEKT|nr:hypothetical protein RF11_00360 [Thelohanellus kitauei]
MFKENEEPRYTPAPESEYATIPDIPETSEYASIDSLTLIAQSDRPLPLNQEALPTSPPLYQNSPPRLPPRKQISQELQSAVSEPAPALPPRTRSARPELPPRRITTRQRGFQPQRKGKTLDLNFK